MIGLGSNRLTVCRRGGMSVTQAGRGGMEWLGVRMPSWASPYSAQATAALKDAYPDLWNTLRQFGVDNPDKVPFINQYPLVAPYLLADGLAFMVDCQYECSAAMWKDIVGNRNFEGTGVTLADGVPYFDGSARYNLAEVLPYMYETCTIECVFVVPAVSNMYMFSITQNNSKTVGVSIQGTYYTNVGQNSIQVPRQGHHIVANNLMIVSNANDTCYENGQLLTYASTDRWGFTGSAGTWIGYSGGRLPMKGKIYAIRIYNRLLTEQEILANQAIDLQRWQAS